MSLDPASTRSSRRPASKRLLLAQSLDRSGLLALARRAVRWRGTLVLTYHRIGDPAHHPDAHPALFSATAELLDHQLSWLARSCEVISPSDLSPATLTGGRRRVLITFDDGYRDLHDLAAPVLASHGVRALLFLCSGFIDGTAAAWWDELAWMIRRAPGDALAPGPWSSEPLSLAEPARPWTLHHIMHGYWATPTADTGTFLDALAEATGAGRRPPPSDQWITWQMARDFQAAGHELGAHTVTHPLLARLDPARQREEVSGSVERITAMAGKRPRCLSYPVGVRSAFDSHALNAARAAGIEFAFNNAGGYTRAGDLAMLDVPRMPSEGLRASSVFRATVSLPAIFARW